MSDPKDHYLPSLDGIRACAVTLVFFAHAGFGDVVPGGFGVTIFFFLSGFLITSLMLREHARTGQLSLSRFYARRLIRLGPPLAIVIFLSWIAVLSGIAEGDLNVVGLLSQVFFFHNYFLAYGGSSFVNGLEILWSLAVEEQFYLIFPVLFIVLRVEAIKLRWVVATLSAILLWRIIRFYILGHSEWVTYLSSDTRFDSILYGCFLSMMPLSLRQRLFPSDAWRRTVTIIGCISVLTITFVVRDEGFRATIRYSLQGIALMPLFYYAVNCPNSLVMRPLNWSVVKLIGVYSYTIYLVHFVIIRSLKGLQFPVNHTVAVWLVAGVGSVAIAALVNRYVELPLKPLRHRLQPRKASTE